MVLRDFLAHLNGLPAKYYKKYFEYDTKQLYLFYNLNIQEAEIITENGLVVGAKMTYIFPEHCQALQKNVHGGCISFVFDSFLGVCLGFARLLPVGAIMQTRELRFELFKPIPTGKSVLLSTSFKNISEERKFLVSGEIRDKETNTLLAIADAFFLKIEIEKLM